MSFQFKRLSDHKDVDIIPYIKNILETKKDVQIYIGTDSQNQRKYSVFASVIVFHYGNSGGHVLYAKEKILRYKTNRDRLWKEVELSIAIASFLKDNEVRVKFIDLDLNPDPKYQSNEILLSAVGWITALGFNHRIKGLGPYSTVMADVLCR